MTASGDRKTVMPSWTTDSGTPSVSGKLRSDAGGPRCLVLGADVTYDNTPSIRMLQANGFEVTGEFCWSKGQKPANEIQLVRFKPKDHQCVKP